MSLYHVYIKFGDTKSKLSNPDIHKGEAATIPKGLL